MDSDDVILRIEREAEREIRQLETRLHDATARAEKAEAELEAARPMIEAARAASPYLPWVRKTVEGYREAATVIGKLDMAERAYRESQPKPGEK